MRREAVVGQCFPIGKQAHAQLGREPWDFLKQALGISSAGGQYGQQPALSSLVRQLRDVQRIRRARKGWQLRALARFE